MQLLDLPVEILHNILFYASLSRGLARALRLKLVCRSFYTAINPVLFRTHLPRRFISSTIPPRWRIMNYHGAENFWHDYIMYQVRHESDPQVANYIEMRQLVEKLCIHVGGDFESTLDGLCWATIGHDTRVYDQDKLYRRNHGGSSTDSNLLSAAAHLGHIPLAKKLMKKGCCPYIASTLFPTPTFLAAFAGNTEMLKLFQQHLPACGWSQEFAIEGLSGTSGFSIEGLSGASERGDVDTLQLIVSLERLTRDEADRFYYDLVTKSVDVLCSSLTPWSNYDRHNRYKRMLNFNIENGNPAIVRHILERHASDFWRRPDEYCKAVGQAVRTGLIEMVDLLLDYNMGLQTQQYNSLINSLLKPAVRAGSLYITRKLLDRGAGINTGYYFLLRIALLHEHTEMLELLSTQKRLNKLQRSGLRRLALLNGLESMAKVVEGFECDPTWDEIDGDFIFNGYPVERLGLEEFRCQCGKVYYYDDDLEHDHLEHDHLEHDHLEHNPYMTFHFGLIK